MKSRRVLLVEDSPNDAKLTLAAFEESGIESEIVWVKDGQEALDYLLASEGPPAVVLLDIKLPKIDGHEVLERMKRDPVLCTIPVVMLTSSSHDADLTRSYAAGVNAYVVKPVGFPEYVAALRGLGLFWTVVNQPPPATGSTYPPRAR